MFLKNEPDRIAYDKDSVIYLLSGSDNRIYRWSLDYDFPMTPIEIGGKALLMTYDSLTHCLYLGYDSGTITCIHLDDGIQESQFAATPAAPHGLAIAGNYVLLADSSGAWNTHYIYTSDGRFVTSEEWNRRSMEYAWNEFNDRMYFFRDGTSPNDLHYEVIDQQTGQITDDGDSPYHGTYSITPPIRVSNDGSLVLLGSGDFYDANTLELVDSLPITLTDAALVTLRETPDGRTLLEQWSSEYELFNFEYFEGQPLRVFERAGDAVVVALINEKPVFHIYML
jgi:hypothetical protein